MIIMPSNKKHIAFALLMALPFFPDVFYLSLAVIGTTIIDFDHNVKINNLFVMTLFGILLTLLLYILKLPLFLGLLIIFMAILFLICKDRGFMHSLIGITLSTVILTILILGLYFLIYNFTINKMVILVLILAFLGFLALNIRIVGPYIVLVVIGLLLLPNTVISIYSVFGALFLGFLSHVTMDLFTPSGVALFSPLFKRKFHKITGLIILIAWIIFALFYLIFI